MEDVTMNHDPALEDLIQRTGRGDMKAFGELYELCSRSVFAYALSVLRKPDPAGDVVQDTFLRIWRSAPSYAPQGRPMAWVLRIARNLCLDELRRSAAFSAAEDDAEPADASASFDADAVQRAYLQTLLDDVLTGEEREIVRLRIYGGLSHAEIAQVLGLSSAVVRWKYAYALKKLRKRYADDEWTSSKGSERKDLFL